MFKNLSDKVLRWLLIGVLAMVVLVDSSIRVLSMAYDAGFLVLAWFIIRELLKGTKKT